MKGRRFETEAIHAGYEAGEYHGSLVPPLFQSSTFTFDNAKQGERRFAGEEAVFIYSRLSNPTVKVLEERMAVLEGAESALAFGSGMAAVSAVLISLVKSGKHIVCSEGVYGCTYGLLGFLKEKFNVEHDFSHMRTREELEKAIKPQTACLYIETPINPTMRLVDLSLAAEVAKERGIPVVVDNTFCSPYLQRPIEAGCDIVVHSATKYICGHGDVVAGIAAGSGRFMEKIAKNAQKDIGGVISPFDAWLLLRGLKTLPLRMERHSENAAKLAAKLASHPAVEKVYYPGSGDHPDYPIAQKQMSLPGGLISFTVKGGKERAQAVLDRLELIKTAVSLGDAETLIQHPASMTHAVVPADVREKMGITESMLRLSAGLEAWEDIWSDLERGLGE